MAIYGSLLNNVGHPCSSATGLSGSVQLIQLHLSRDIVHPPPHAFESVYEHLCTTDYCTLHNIQHLPPVDPWLSMFWLPISTRHATCNTFSCQLSLIHLLCARIFRTNTTYKVPQAGLLICCLQSSCDYSPQNYKVIFGKLLTSALTATVIATDDIVVSCNTSACCFKRLCDQSLLEAHGLENKKNRVWYAPFFSPIVDDDDITVEQHKLL